MGTDFDEVKALSWFHQIDLGNGILTPGICPPNELILGAFDQIDFSGKRVLDIGCWDGLWSFESERRGAAEVYATDDISQRSFGSTRPLNVAKSILKSNVRYLPEVSIEKLPALGLKFDVVLFLGVYYHLRDPLHALAIIRSILNDGGLVVVEGDVIYNRRKSFAKFLYQDIWKNDASNWWIPSVRCLEEWVASSFFLKKSTFLYTDKAMSRLIYAAKRIIGTVAPRRSVGRAVLVAQAVSGKDPRWVFHDPLFAGIDANTYGKSDPP